MANSLLNRDDLEKVLEMVFNDLTKKGILQTISPTEKYNIIMTVANSIEAACPDGISRDQLREPTMLHSLQLSLVSGFVAQKDPAFNFNMGLLFQNRHELSPQDQNQFKLELKNEIKNLLTAINQLDPHLLRRQQMSLKLEPIAQSLTDGLLANDPEMLAQNENTLSAFSEMLRCTPQSTAVREDQELTLALKNLYGGVDPRIEGGQRSPVLEIVGNLAGIADFGPALTNEAAIDESSRPDNNADYTGAKTGAKERQAAMGGFMELLEEFEEEGLLDKPHTPSNWPPRPAPPGHTSSSGH